MLFILPSWHQLPTSLLCPELIRCREDDNDNVLDEVFSNGNGDDMEHAGLAGPDFLRKVADLLQGNHTNGSPLNSNFLQQQLAAMKGKTFSLLNIGSFFFRTTCRNAFHSHKRKRVTDSCHDPTLSSLHLNWKFLRHPWKVTSSNYDTFSWLLEYKWSWYVPMNMYEHVSIHFRCNK